MMKQNTMHYRGYAAAIQYDDEDGLFVGDVLDLRDGITFTGETVAELKEGFCRAVDAYLEWCAERGEEPDRPFLGRVNLRLEPEDHRSAAVAAASRRISLNQFLVWCVKRGLEDVRRPDAHALAWPLQFQAATATRLLPVHFLNAGEPQPRQLSEMRTLAVRLERNASELASPIAIERGPRNVAA